mmetsp:Transcript_23665/g.26337  ORF Transcript_23665/g.26337 Transcript_23665/m.26337 type:complete len:240 (+) Transcript_23665:64-783(+)
MFQQSPSFFIIMIAVVILLAVAVSTNLLVVEGLAAITPRPTMNNNNHNHHQIGSTCSRREAFLQSGKSSVGVVTASVLGGILSPFPLPAHAEQGKETRQGNEVTAFNGLAFNYKGGDFGGLDASTIEEPTVSYKEFNERMKAGEVVFVEFMAPDGDVAYATFKETVLPNKEQGSEGGENIATAPTTTTPIGNKKIRIGEGYPIEQHDGYSSPMFCIRAVKNAGVPYKFTVKGLSSMVVE